MTTGEERITYCQICEALCGLVATVADDRLVRLRPDPAHPMSAGYCFMQRLQEVGERRSTAGFARCFEAVEGRCSACLRMIFGSRLWLLISGN
ncbi:hypothetical protein [Kribbella solani]|uniref:hypothetical protein n=1 Tax=Kribbella solani TaxID=236067 RepID=UPI0038D4155F